MKRAVICSFRVDYVSKNLSVERLKGLSNKEIRNGSYLFVELVNLMFGPVELTWGSEDYHFSSVRSSTLSRKWEWRF